MSTRKPYKIRSQETWDLIRAAYLGGETARVVAHRFDVTAGAIERRAGREGWTKKAWAQARAAASAPPPEPGRAPGDAAVPDEVDWQMTFPLAMGEAEAALRAGRGGEAMRLMLAAEHYLKLRHRLEDVNARHAAQQAQMSPEAVWTQIADKAMAIARALVGPHGGGPAFMGRKTFAWRARTLGPEVAAADFEQGRDGGWGGHYWNPDGSLKDPQGEGWTEEELKEMRR